MDQALCPPQPHRAVLQSQCPQLFKTKSLALCYIKTSLHALCITKGQNQHRVLQQSHAVGLLLSLT